jgi:hypothetical protein
MTLFQSGAGPICVEFKDGRRRNFNNPQDRTSEALSGWLFSAYATTIKRKPCKSQSQGLIKTAMKFIF